jgi:hypothetical protein
MRMGGRHAVIKQFTEAVAKFGFSFLGIGGARVEGELEAVKQRGQFR